MQASRDSSPEETFLVYTLWRLGLGSWSWIVSYCCCWVQLGSIVQINVCHNSIDIDQVFQISIPNNSFRWNGGSRSRFDTDY